MSKKLFSNLLILSLIVQASIGLFAFPNQAKATGTIYYVDNTITDTNVGSATPDCTNYDPAAFICSGGSASAYKTIVDVNLKLFSAGDSVLFRQGQTWRESLTVPSSGTNGNPITFGAYGSGAKPIISGADLATSWIQETQTSTATAGDSTSTGVNNTLYTTYLYYVPVTLPAGAVTSINFYSAAATAKAQTAIYTDVSGSPSALVADSGSGEITLTANSWNQFTFTSNPTVSSGSYWLAIKVSANITGVITGGTQPSIKQQSASAYASAWPATTGTPSAVSRGMGFYAAITLPSFNSYYATFASVTPNTVIENSAILQPAASKLALIPGTWYWESGTTRAYVRTVGDTDPSNYVMEVPQRNYAINTAGRDYLNIQDLSLQAANLNGLFFGGDSTSLVVQRNDISLSYGAGIRNQSSAILTASTISGNTVHQNGASGILLVTSGVTSNILSNNTISYNSQIYSVAADHQYGGGIYLWTTGSGNIITGNTVFRNGYRDNNISVAATAKNGAGLWFDTVGVGNVMSYNVSHDNNMDGLKFEDTSGSSMLYNVSYANSNASNYSSGLIVGSYNKIAPSADNLIYNNTLYNNYYGLYVTGYSPPAAGTVTGNLVKNNLVTSSTSGYNLWTQYGGENDGTNGSGNVYAYNGFGAAATNFIRWGFSVPYSTYALWEAATGNCGSTGCSHSVAGDPLFTNAAAGDFTLQAGSPAIDAGTPLADTYKLGLNPNSVWPSAVNTLDQTLNGSGWEMGAYVYSQSSAPTVSISAPSAGTVSGTITITANPSASSPASISSVQFTLDGSNLDSAVTVAPYSITWNSASVSDGSHTLSAVATDNYSNTATAAAITVSVSNGGSGGGGGAVYPSIYGVTVPSTTQTTALISWKTDYNTNSEVDYGTSTVYGLVKTDSAATTTHIILLNNLVSATTYQFKVKSNLNGITASSNNSSFTTLTAGGQTLAPTPPPVGVPATPLAFPTSSATRLINNNGTFYLIQNGVLQGITGPGILNSYGFEFKDASAATTDDLALPQGGLLLPANGALVKSNQDKTVYLISGGQRHAFTSAGVFTGLGFKFSSVLLVTNPELQALPEGLDISDPSSAHLDGVNINDQGTIYWINNRIRYSYPSIEVYNSWNIDNNFTRVVPANAADLALPVGEVIISRIIQ